MPNVRAIQIRHYGDGKHDRITLPKKTASEDIEIGDFLRWDGTGVVKMSAANQDTTFVGISGTKSANADGPREILVYQKANALVPVTNAQYTPGQGLKVHASNDELVDDDGSLTIAWSIEFHGANTALLRVHVDVVGLQKLYGVGGAPG